jgi:hypothetical protein
MTQNGKIMRAIQNLRCIIIMYYNNQGIRIHDTHRPSVSDTYTFILNNRSSQYDLTAKVTLTHNWYQEIKNID